MSNVQQIACSFDLETFGGLNSAWGRVMCGVLKPWGEEDQVFVISKPSDNDSVIVEAIMVELRKYPILIAHNGLYFDVPFLNGRAAEYNLPPINPFHKLIDPCQIARKRLNLGRNSLDSIVAHMGLEEQKMHLPPSVWVRAALDRDPDALDTLVERCRSDVRILEKITDRLMPLTRNITSFGSA